jgi:hypothetical protein
MMRPVLVALLLSQVVFAQAAAPAAGPPHILVLPLHGDPAGLAHALVRDAVTSEDRVVMVDGDAPACVSDACALQEAVQRRVVSHVVYGDASNGLIHLRCLEVRTGDVLGDVQGDMSDGDWSSAVAVVVPEALVVEEERVPLLWGRAGMLVVNRRTTEAEDNDTLGWAGRVAAGVGGLGLATAFGLLVLAAVGGVLLPAYLAASEPFSTLQGSRLAERIVVLGLGGAGTAAAAVLGGLLVATMTPTLLLGAGMLMVSGAVLD